MRLDPRVFVCAVGFVLAASPALAGYVVKPVEAPGDFVPVTISDDGLVAGTLTVAAGSLAFVTNGASGAAYDFCGAHGAADHTTITATPPYSVQHYLAGACGYASGFLYDVVRRVVIPIATTSSSGTTVDAVGPSGTVAGIIDVHSGGNTPYFERRGHYTTFIPGQFSVISQITLSGLIVGSSYNAGGSGSGFTLRPGGVLNIVQPPSPNTGSYVSFFGGNRRGQLAAAVTDRGKTRAAIWQCGHFMYPGLPPGTASSSARAINENGDVAGTFKDTTGTSHVFVWHTTTSGVEEVLAPFDVTNFSVIAINNKADIVGIYTRANHMTAYIATHGPM